MNITKQSHYNVYTITILLFRWPMWSGQWPTRGPRARSGPGPQFNIKLFCGPAGPGHNCCGPGRAGPGPHNSMCGPGRVCTTAAGPSRAWASNHICGPGLGLDVRPVQGPSTYYTERYSGNRSSFERRWRERNCRQWTSAVPD